MSCKCNCLCKEQYSNSFVAIVRWESCIHVALTEEAKLATYGGLGAPLSRIKIEETARSALTVYLCNNLSKVGHICTFYIERPDFSLNIVLQINFPIHFKEWLKFIKKSCCVANGRQLGPVQNCQHSFSLFHLCLDGKVCITSPWKVVLIFVYKFPTKFAANVHYTREISQIFWKSFKIENTWFGRCVSTDARGDLFECINV